MPVWDDKAQEVQKDLEKQLTVSEGMYIGTKLANEGLPGSLMVKDFRKP